MPIKVRLLGRASVQRGDSWTQLPLDKRLGLLAYLACADGWVSREKLAFLFWPDSEEQKGRTNLRQLLNRLKSLPIDNLELDAKGLAWEVESDVRAFREALRRGAWEEAIGHYGGPFLEGLEDDESEFSSWLTLERQDLRAAWQQASMQQAESLQARALHDEAAALLEALLELEEDAEEALLAHLQLCQEAGWPQRGLDAYRRYRLKLEQDLGLEPSQDARELAEALEKSAKEAPPTPPQPAVSLPHQTTPFVGREREVGALNELLQQEDCRLLTLVGPGGVGKTRLALEVARSALGAFPDGATFVPLSGVLSPELIPSATADALKLAQYGQGSAQLLRYLERRTLLLVMDNLEHLLADVGVLEEMLLAAPKLKILATSRERLKRQAEHVYELRGLAYASSALANDALGEAFEDYDASKLLLKTINRVSPGYRLTREDRAFAARICQAVEGLPLALELAAAWKYSCTLEEIALELERGLDFLNAEANFPERHRSMRVVFDQSWRLLSPEAQRGFAQLAVFRGGFRREAAQAVAGTSLALLASLVDASFLNRDPTGRYLVHELLRQYGEAQLSQEASEARQRHAHHFAAFVTAREKGLRGPEQQRVLGELERELDNLRAALDWTISHGALDLGLELGLGLLRFWLVRGQLEEGYGKLMALLDLSPEEALEARARLLSAAGTLTQNQGEYARAQALFEQGLALWRRLGDEAGIAATLNHLGWLGWRRGHYAHGRELSLEALGAYEKLAKPAGIATSLNNLAWLAHHQGDYQASLTHHERSLALRRDLGDQRAVAFSLVGLGWTLQELGAYDRAGATLEEALALFKAVGEQQLLAFTLSISAQGLRDQGRLLEAEARLKRARQIFSDIGDKYGLALTLDTLGGIRRLAGKSDEAQALLEESLSLRESIGDRWGVASAKAGLARLGLYRGELAQAESLFNESLTIRLELGDKRGLTRCFYSLAEICGLTDRAEQAAWFLGAAKATEASLSEPLLATHKAQLEKLALELRAQLPESAFRELEQAGKEAAANLDPETRVFGLPSESA